MDSRRLAELLPRIRRWKEPSAGLVNGVNSEDVYHGPEPMKFNHQFKMLPQLPQLFHPESTVPGPDGEQLSVHNVPVMEFLDQLDSLSLEEHALLHTQPTAAAIVSVQRLEQFFVLVSVVVPPSLSTSTLATSVWNKNVSRTTVN